MNDNTYELYIEQLYNCCRICSQAKCRDIIGEFSDCRDCEYYMKPSTKRDIMAETLRRIRVSKKEYNPGLKAYNPVNLDKLNDGVLDRLDGGVRSE